MLSPCACRSGSSISVWRCSDFLSETYDMLPCVIPFRKYACGQQERARVTVFHFSHEAICICQLQFSSAVFLHLFCHVCLWCLLLLLGAGSSAVQIYREFLISIAAASYPNNRLTHTHTNYYPLPIRRKEHKISSRIMLYYNYYNADCDLIEPECENLRFTDRDVCVCVSAFHGILLCIITTCTAIIIK